MKTKKTVIPFCTHEGNGLADTVNKQRQTRKGAKILERLAVHGETAQNPPLQARQSVKA